MEAHETDMNGSRWNIPQIVFALILVLIFLLLLGADLRFRSHPSEEYGDEEHFTELYVDDVRLVNTDDGGVAAVLFSFTIQNREGEDTEYSYLVSVERGDEMALIDEDVVTLKDKEQKTVLEYYEPPAESEEEGKILIELPLQEQSVHLLLPVREEKYE